MMCINFIQMRVRYVMIIMVIPLTMMGSGSSHSGHNGSGKMRENAVIKDILHAISIDDMATMVSLIDEHHPAMNSQHPPHANTFLMEAIDRKCSFATVEHLLRLKADPNSSNNKGETVLGLAIKDISSAKTALLLDHKADPNTNIADVSPLFYSLFMLEKKPLRENSVEMLSIIRSLLINRAHCNIVNRPSGLSPLLLVASALKQPSIASVLIEHNAYINQVDANNNNALMLAIKSANKPVFDFLLDNSNINLSLNNSEGKTPIMIAHERAYSGSKQQSDIFIQMIHALIEKGVVPCCRVHKVKKNNPEKKSSSYHHDKGVLGSKDSLSNKHSKTRTPSISYSDTHNENIHNIGSNDGANNNQVNNKVTQSNKTICVVQ